MDTSTRSIPLTVNGRPRADSLLPPLVSRFCGNVIAAIFGPLGWRPTNVFHRMAGHRDSHQRLWFSADQHPEGPLTSARSLHGGGGRERVRSHPLLTPMTPSRLSATGETITLIAVKACPVVLVRSASRGDGRLRQAIATLPRIGGRSHQVDLPGSLGFGIKILQCSSAPRRELVLISRNAISPSQEVEGLLQIALNDKIGVTLIALESAALTTAQDPLTLLAAALDQQMRSGELVLVVEASAEMLESVNGHQRARYVADALLTRLFRVTSSPSSIP
jgi:hypothetical protein